MKYLLEDDEVGFEEDYVENAAAWGMGSLATEGAARYKAEG